MRTAAAARRPAGRTNATSRACDRRAARRTRTPARGSGAARTTAARTGLSSLSSRVLVTRLGARLPAAARSPTTSGPFAIAIGRLPDDGRDIAREKSPAWIERRGTVVADAEQPKHRLARGGDRVEVAHGPCPRRSAAGKWWARRGLNPQPSGYEPPALTVELRAPPFRARQQPETQRSQPLPARRERQNLVAKHDSGKPSRMAVAHGVVGND